jgi:hypothetical protein
VQYKTSLGRVVEYPYTIAKELCSGSEKEKQLVDATRKIFEELQRIDSELITYREDNKRLLIENQFMIRLINMRDNQNEL